MSVSLRRFLTLSYGDALASESRIDGDVPVMSSGGISGAHAESNTLGPAIVVGRKGSYGSVHWTEVPAFVIDTAYYVDSRNTKVDLRWLFYVLQTLDLSGASSDVGIPGLSRENVYERHINYLPSMEEQRRIADFLDDQVGRIDQAIALREGQVGIAAFREERQLQDLVWDKAEPTQLRRLGTHVTTGPFGTVFAATDYVSGGIPMINPTHIHDGKLLPDSEHSVAPSTASRLVRHQLRAGDVVSGRKGDLGRSALVRDEQDGWICGSDSIAIHPDSTRLLPEFLDLVLHLPKTRADLVSQSGAATMPSLNEGMLMSLEVPSLSIGEQLERTKLANEVREGLRRYVSVVKSGLAELKDRRSSLIAACVAGQLDVTSARSLVGPWISSGVSLSLEAPAQAVGVAL